MFSAIGNFCCLCLSISSQRICFCSSSNCFTWPSTSTQSTIMEARLRMKLQQANESFVCAVASDQDPAAFLSEWSTLQEEMRIAITSGSLGDDFILATNQLTRRINLVAAAMVNASTGAQTLQSLAVQQSKQCWATSPTSTFCTPSKHITDLPVSGQAQATVVAEMPSFAAYRIFFLSHFTHPYPSAAQKTELLLTAPLHNLTQLSTWFVNARRRSGWQDLFKVYANGSRIELELIMTKLEDGRGRDWEVDEECRNTVVLVKNWFMEGGRDRVEPSIQEAIKKGLKAGTGYPLEIRIPT